MNCGTCKHWNLKGSPLRQYGYGQCKVDPNEAMRTGRTMSAQNVCRIEKFSKADVKVIARREREMAVSE